MNYLYCLLLVLLTLANEVFMVPIKYPLTLGAFTSNTYIDDLLVLPNTDIVILGASNDTSLVTLNSPYTSRRYLAYFDNAVLMNYRWAVQLPVGLDSYTYRSLDYKEDVTQVVVMLTKQVSSSCTSSWPFFNTCNQHQILIFNLVDGALAKHHLFIGNNFSESRRSFCIFFNSMVYAFFYENQSKNSVTFIKINPSLTSIGSSPQTLYRIPDTDKHQMHGINRYNDILVSSLYDDDQNINYVHLMQSSTTSGISVVWRLGFFKNKGTMRYIDFTQNIQTPPFDRKIFGCMESQQNLNRFYFTRFISQVSGSTFLIPSDQSGSDQILIYEFTASSSINNKYYCQGVKAIDDVTFYVAMISSTSADGMSVEIYHNTIVAGLNLISDKMFWRKNLGANLQFVRMIDSTSLYVVSKSVFDTYANGGVANSFRFVPLIYSTNPLSSYIDVSWNSIIPLTQSPSSYNPDIDKPSNSALARDVTIIYDSQTITQVTLKNAAYNNIDTCMISGAPNITLNVNHFIPEPYQYTVVPSPGTLGLISNFPQCDTNFCATENIQVAGTAVSSITFTNVGTDVKIQTTATSLSGMTYDVYYRALWPTGTYTNCVLFNQIMRVTFNYVTISSVAVSNIVYNLGQGPIQFNLPYFTLSSVQTDPRLVPLKYDLKTNTNLLFNDLASPTNLFITSFTDSGSALSVTIDTSAFTDQGTYSMKLFGMFNNFNPTYTVSSAFTIKIVAPCNANVITPSTGNETMYHLSGTGPQVFNIGIYSELFGGLCGTISYSALNMPSIASFDGTTNPLIFTLNTAANLASNTYNVDIKASMSSISSVTKTYRFYIIQPATTLIIAPVIPPIQYYQGDPKLTKSIAAFTATDSRFPLKYTLTNSFGFAFDSNLIEFTTIPQLQVGVYTQLASKIGKYPLTLTAQYDILIEIKAQVTFEVEVLHQCLRNVVKSQSIPNLNYNIGQAKSSSTFNGWTQSMTSCGPILKYEAFLQSDGTTTPPFLTVDTSTKTINVFTNDLSMYGKYPLKIFGAPQLYASTSILESLFTVNIGCMPKTITRVLPETLWQFSLGGLQSQSFNFGQIKIDPDCPSVDNSLIVASSVTLSTGVGLPAYISFNGVTHDFNVSPPDGTQPLMLNMVVTFKVMQGTVVKISQSFPQKLQILAKGVQEEIPIPVELASANQLPIVTLRCKPDDLTTYESKDFQNTLETYTDYTLVNPRQLKFVTLKGQVLQIKPSLANSGIKYKVFLAATDSTNNKKYSQTINIQVISYAESLKSKNPLEAYITSISQNGLVEVTFSHVMMAPQNVSLIDTNYLELKIQDSSFAFRKDLNYTWRPISFSGKQLMIQMNFTDPLKVSSQDSDYLLIKVLQNDLFMSIETQEFLNISYTMKKRISKQLDIQSMKLSAIFDSIEGKLGTLLAGKVTGPVVAILLSRIWAMVKAIQIDLLLPLGDVILPANIQLTGKVIQKTTQQEFLKALSFDTFEFLNTTGFSKNFEDQGFDSVYVIDNLRPIYKNLNLVSIAMAFFLILDLLIKVIFKKEIGLFDKLKHVVVFNLIISLLVENSLQLCVFSLINIQESKPTDKNQTVSMVFAAIYLTLLCAIAVVNIAQYRKVTKENCKDIATTFPKTASLYLLLDVYNRRTLIFKTIFIARRLITALVYVTLKDHQAFQIHIQLLITLSSIYYLVTQPPFASKTLNYIELGNEIMVMACQYFMLVFACDITDDILHAQLGFNFSMLVLAHLIIGFLALMITKIINFLPTLKKVWIKIKEYWPKLKEKLEGIKNKLCNRARKTPQYQYGVPQLDDIERAKVREQTIEDKDKNSQEDKSKSKDSPFETEKKLMDDLNMSFGKLEQPKNDGLKLKSEQQHEDINQEFPIEVKNDVFNEIEELKSQINENMEQQKALIERISKPEVTATTDITEIAVPINENRREMRVVRTINAGGIKQRYAKKR